MPDGRSGFIDLGESKGGVLLPACDSSTVPALIQVADGLPSLPMHVSRDLLDVEQPVSYAGWFMGLYTGLEFLDSVWLSTDTEACHRLMQMLLLLGNGMVYQFVVKLSYAAYCRHMLLQVLMLFLAVVDGCWFGNINCAVVVVVDAVLNLVLLPNAGALLLPPSRLLSSPDTDGSCKLFFLEHLAVQRKQHLGISLAVHPDPAISLDSFTRISSTSSGGSQ
ncbi:hypothetical protein Nepgr_024744 [Nepenthes gracilis]|uniref:Uncharacterized protein n=1 Tax=Nepenthes gracilis TaxID=150966 RepID=A0AAD3T5B1_NEPGR|nr:hypothetical protein Nepgr_024744 [Nepenthes gracilis]